MRNSEKVLSSLANQAESETYRFERLIRNFYNPNFYNRALRTIYADHTIRKNNSVKNGFSPKDIDRIIHDIQNETFDPAPLRRGHLLIPTFQDRLVLEVMKLLLETIYEPVFRPTSHAFRQNRNCHTALRQVDLHFFGVKWFVTGGIKGCFSSINHHILLQILYKRIKDEKLLRLLCKFLQSGYLNDWRYGETYSGTPNGGVISPILSNIYLHELDKFIEDLQQKFDQGRLAEEYEKYHALLIRYRKKYKENPSKSLLLEMKMVEKKLENIYSHDTQAKAFKRICYVRYADDFLVGIIGSKKDAEEIQRKICTFLKEKLGVYMSKDTSEIIHVTNTVPFLGYNITQDRIRCSSQQAENLEFYMPSNFAVNYLKDTQAIKYNRSGNWKPVARYYLTNLSDLDLVTIYNREIQSVYNYFMLAKNIQRQMSTLIYGLEYSCLGTMARKHKSSIGKIKQQLRKGKEWGVKYYKGKEEKFLPFFNQPIQQKKILHSLDSKVDQMFTLRKSRN